MFILRIWNIVDKEPQKIIEYKVNVQDLEYICPLEATDLRSNNIDSFHKAEGDFILANMSTTVFTNIFNVLLFFPACNLGASLQRDSFPNAGRLFHHSRGLLAAARHGHPEDGGVPSHSDHEPRTGSLWLADRQVDFHFTLTTLQQLYMQQSRTKQNDDRMSLMKDMVKDVMSGPMAANEKNVASKCLMNDILQLRAEEATLKEHLAEGGRSEAS